MNQDELIEKCRLTDDKMGYYLSSDCGLGYPADYWDVVVLEDWHKLVEAQLRKAIPIIEAEARKAERERIADWLEQQEAIWVDKNYTIIKAIRQGKS